MLLDVRTVMFGFMMSAIVCLLVTCALHVHSRRRYAGTGFWVLDFALHAIAFLLITLRGSVPDWLSIIAANLMAVVGAVLMYMGLERFLEKKTSQAHNYALIIASLCVHTYCTQVRPSLEARTVNASATLFLIYGQCAWLMLYRAGPALKRLTLGSGLCFLALALVSLARIPTVLFVEHREGDFLQPSIADPGALLSYQMLTILLTFSLILMVSRRLLEEVRFQEEKFSKAFHSSPYAITLTRMSDGQIIEVNKGFEDITGFTPAEAIGKTTLNLRLWRRDEDRVTVIGELAKTGRSRTQEVAFRSKTGQTITGLFSADVVTVKGEALVLSSISDITSRKRAEDTIRASERFLQAVLHASVDGFLVIGQSGTIIEVNDAYCAMSGFSRGELLGMGMASIKADDDPAGTAARIQRIAASGGEVFEERHRRKDGGVWPVEVSAAWLDDGGGRLVCFCRDLTERRHREERIALLGQMIDAAPAAITVHDTQGVFVYANRLAATLHGYGDPAEFMSVNLHALDVPESEALVAERLRLIEQKGEARFEVAHHRKDGASFPLEVQAKAITWEGRPAVLSIATDITERRQMERQNRLFASIIRRSQDFIGMAGADQRAFYVNPAGQAMIGLDGDEAVAKTSIEDYFFPEDLPFVRQTILPALMNHGRWSGEFRFRHFKTGQPVYVLYDLFLAEDPETQGLTHITTITRNITERKQADQALRDATMKLQEAVRAADVGLWEWDLVANKVLFSSEWKRQIGYEEHEIGDAFAEWESRVHPDDLAPTMDRVRRAVANLDQGYRTEFRLRHKDGSYRWILAQGSALAGAGGRAVRVLGSHVDITERKQAEEELRRREGLLEKIFEILPIGLWLADKNGTLLRGNPTGVRIWGAEPHVPISEYGVFKAWRLPSREPVGPEDWALAKTIRQGVTVSDELLEIEAFDGKRRAILNYTAPVLGPSGEIQGAIIVNLDVTDRRSLEEQLRQSQKMESVGRLAGGVAHDFNNMLGIILGNAEMALRKLGPNDPLRDDLQEIASAARRSTEITRQLLAFARRQTIAPRVLDLNQTVEGMLRMLGRLLGENIHLRWNPASGLSPVRMDPTQIGQILANLCVNARDAIADVGTITIETGSAVLDRDYCASHAECVPGEYVLLSVSDDGCGMDRQTLDKLFEPFFTTKSVGKGTGLGLATVYGIVRQNSGFIHAYSEPGKGATFKIYLPPHKGEAAPSPAQESAGAPMGRGETVLIVEDEPGLLKLGKVMLEKLGYSALAAATPAEAIRLAQEHSDRLALLVTDVVMPEMNGRELAKRIIELCPQVRVLYMSGYTANVIAHSGVLDPGVLFIEKPFSKNDLAIRVRQALEGAVRG